MAIDWIVYGGISMNKLGLVLSTSRYSRHLIDRIFSDISDSKEALSIEVLYVIESDQLEEISKQVGGSGFLGAGLQQDVLESLQAEHHRMALERISEVRQRAKERSIVMKLTEVQGNFMNSVLNFAEQKQCAAIYLTREDKPFISRFLFGSEADKIAKLVKKEGLGTVVIDHD